jgi:hypothetical protein
MGQRDTSIAGNTNLIEYGIQTEESDYRIHVSFAVGKAYLFPTASGKLAIEQELGQPFEASQPGVSIITGVGRKVPWQEIKDCQEISIPHSWLKKINCQKRDGPSVKGKKAVTIAKSLLLRGYIPLPIATREIKEKDIQVTGRDLIVTSQWSIEVKCDYWGGKYGLALQTHECNPFGRH